MAIRPFDRDKFIAILANHFPDALASLEHLEAFHNDLGQYFQEVPARPLKEAHDPEKGLEFPKPVTKVDHNAY